MLVGWKVRWLEMERTFVFHTVHRTDEETCSAQGGNFLTTARTDLPWKHAEYTHHCNQEQHFINNNNKNHD